MLFRLAAIDQFPCPRPVVCGAGGGDVESRLVYLLVSVGESRPYMMVGVRMEASGFAGFRLYRAQDVKGF